LPAAILTREVVTYVDALPWVRLRYMVVWHKSLARAPLGKCMYLPMAVRMQHFEIIQFT
jgi:hypothetical protein